jgi:CRP-like cAMP-binding protein
MKMGPCRNGILADLPPDDLAFICRFLGPVSLKERVVLQQPRQPIRYVDFIESGMISLRTLGAGDVLETALIGRQGAAGTSVALGCELSAFQSIVVAPGKALRIHADDLRLAMRERPLIRERLLRYLHALMIHGAQMALCGMRHDLEQRLACWLGLACDALGSHILPITHEDLSIILGLRRPSVTEMLNRMEEDGLIRKMRGVMEIRDRERLKLRMCGCHAVISGAYRNPTGKTSMSNACGKRQLQLEKSII